MLNIASAKVKFDQHIGSGQGGPEGGGVGRRPGGSVKTKSVLNIAFAKVKFKFDQNIGSGKGGAEGGGAGRRLGGALKQNPW